MSSVIEVSGLSKQFKLYRHARDRVKEWIHPLRKKYHTGFQALNDVSFTIRSGETVGIIGRNGSGKSTILQIISGVMSPSNGNVNVNGRIAALLELGTGFDNELTGRENLFLNGSIMGFTAEEVQARIPEIESFADIGHFIDQPVKVYSSGMFVRLAFAAAIHVDPDILIVDEALAVGDVKFQNKCYRKFHEFKKLGKTIIFVTHSTDLIAKHCDRAILLHNGTKIEDGEPNQVINRYLELLLGIAPTEADDNTETVEEQTPLIIEQDVDVDGLPKAIKSFIQSTEASDRCSQNPTYNQNEHRYGSEKGRVVDFLVYTGQQINPVRIDAHEMVEIYVKYNFLDEVKIPIYGFTLKTLDGVEILGSNNLFEKQDVRPRERGEIAIYKIKLPFKLISGEYFFSIGLAEFVDGDTPPIDRRYDLIHLKVANSSSRYGLVDLDMEIEEII